MHENNLGFSALHEAISNGELEIVRLLLAHESVREMSDLKKVRVTQWRAKGGAVAWAAGGGMCER